MAIGQRLRQALELRGMSIRKFQKEMQTTGADGTSYPAINRALKDETTPSLEFLDNAAGLLKVRPGWLILGEGEVTAEEQLKHKVPEMPLAMRGVELDLTNVKQILEGNLRVYNPLTGDPDHARAKIRFNERFAALERFARKVADAEWLDSPWQQGARKRERLYAAAASFLVGVEIAFDVAGRNSSATYEGNRITYETLPGAFDDDLLLGESWSRGWYVAWSDAVLDLFARRVKGLGERSGTFIDAHAPRMREVGPTDSALAPAEKPKSAKRARKRRQ